MNSNEAEIKHKARLLASRPYEVRFKVDKLSDGTSSYMAYHPDLPGCQSDGATREEAEKNLEDARFVYIYYLLVDGIEVPSPRRMVYFKFEEHISSGYTSSPIHFSRENNRKNEKRNVLEQVVERTAPY